MTDKIYRESLNIPEGHKITRKKIKQMKQIFYRTPGDKQVLGFYFHSGFLCDVQIKNSGIVYKKTIKTI